MLSFNMMGMNLSHNIFFMFAFLSLSCSHNFARKIESRKPASFTHEMPLFFKTIIAQENEDLNLSLSRASVFYELFNKKRSEQREGFFCANSELVSLSILSTEYLLSSNYFNDASKEEVFGFMDYLSSLIDPITLNDFRFLSRSALRNKKNKRLNEDFIKRKELVLIYSFLIYNFQNRFEGTVEKYIPTLINVSKFDSITLIRRIAQLAVTSLMPNRDLSMAFIEQFESHDGAYIFDGKCSEENDYEILEAIKKEGEILASVFIPEEIISFNNLRLHECPKEKFKLCFKPLEGERVDITFKEYDEIKEEKKKFLIDQTAIKLLALERNEYQGEELREVLLDNIATVEALIMSYERYNNFIGNAEEREFRLHSDGVYMDLNLKLKENHEKLRMFSENRIDLVTRELIKFREFVSSEEWYELPIGSFSNGVTSQYSYQNGRLAKMLKAQLLNGESVNFIELLRMYADEELLGESLSKRVLESTR